MKKIKRIFLVFLLIPFLSAHVKNLDKPLRAEWDFKLEKIWEIDKAGSDTFGRPSGLLVSEEGWLYVYDAGNKINYIFDENGHFLKTFARSGLPPGEVLFQKTSHLVNGNIIIPGIKGINCFTKDGKYIKTVKLKSVVGTPHIFIDGNNYIAIVPSAFHMPGSTAQIVKRNLVSGRGMVIADFSLYREGTSNSEGFEVHGLTPEIILGYYDYRIYWGMNDSYVINVSDLAGKKITSFSLERKRRKVSDKCRREYCISVTFPADAFNLCVDSIPDEMTYFDRIEVHNGLVYVFAWDLDLDAQCPIIGHIDIFSPEGKYLYSAHLNLGENLKQLYSPNHNLVIKDDYIYVVCENKDNHVSISKYKVELPGIE